MTEKPWTPGPWETFPSCNYVGFSIAPRGTLPTLAAVERPAGSESTINIQAFNFPGKTEANARLIAAAPELVEQLERSTEVLNEALNLIDRKHEGFVGDDGFNAVMDAQELLAKLYGDSQ